MTDRPKPPTRRTGRTLNSADKTTSPPPPPPAAELTREQLAAEQAGVQGVIAPAAHEQQAQPVPSTVSVDGPAQGRSEQVAETGQASVTPSVQGPLPSPGQEPVPDQSALAAVGSDTRQESDGEQAQRQVQTAASALHGVQAGQLPGDVPQDGPAPVSHAPQGAEVAVRSTVLPTAGASAFPVKSEIPVSQREQDVRSEAVPSEGAPWAQGPGRPADIPEAAVVLNQRVIARESLDSSVPAALRLKRRIKYFALHNELDHLPIGDIVSVAMDEWLTTRGF